MKPVKGKKFKSFDPEDKTKWVAGTIWDDGTMYIESESEAQELQPRGER
jgi:hypothetical protein